MPLKGPLTAPSHIDPSVWAVLCSVDPGAAIATWMEGQEGLMPETSGPNRGPWLQRILRGGDGLPYCADLLLSVGIAIGAPQPLGPKRGKHRYWHNRAVRSLEASHKRGGTWAGPGVAPQRGWLAFHRNRNGSDSGPGGHVDIVLHYDHGTREIVVIGGNVSNSIKRRHFRLGDPSFTGFGVWAPHVRGVR